ncbi:MAG: hypothetical protein HC813_01230 [Planctomycetes bacterium]|nr:hypothetical protein [Planctomycetota bacterium]
MTASAAASAMTGREFGEGLLDHPVHLRVREAHRLDEPIGVEARRLPEVAPTLLSAELAEQAPVPGALRLLPLVGGLAPVQRARRLVEVPEMEVGDALEEPIPRRSRREGEFLVAPFVQQVVERATRHPRLRLRPSRRGR